MKTAIGHPRYYTLLCKLPASERRYNTPLHISQCNYFDIRDVIQSIINWKKNYPEKQIEYFISCSDRKPVGWINPGRYRDNLN
jgi:hypothetical protein